MIGIRSEDKNRWERRVPLTPSHVAELVRHHRVAVRVQASPLRAFPEQAYRDAGAEVGEDLDGCSVVFGVKEIPIEKLAADTAYMFFAHVLKGQRSNMPMLQKMMDLNASLLDYERVVDGRGKRLIFFGKHAGYAGMIDTLHALGRRLLAEGIENPFAAIQPAHAYPEMEDARIHLRRIAEEIRRDGVPDALHPIVFGFTGTGNVTGGALEMFSSLPSAELTPSELEEAIASDDLPQDVLYRVVLDGADRMEHREGVPFSWDELRADPSRYRSTMDRHLPFLTAIVNGIYWEPGHPAIASKADLSALWSGAQPPRLRVIGDISCDVEGSIEATVRITTPDDPFYVWNPETGEAVSGVAGRGPVILAVDNLPCEIPVDASKDFGDALLRFVPALARCDWSQPFESLGLPPEIRRAVIVHRGRLTPDFAYLEKHIEAALRRD